MNATFIIDPEHHYEVAPYTHMTGRLYLEALRKKGNTDIEELPDGTCRVTVPESVLTEQVRLRLSGKSTSGIYLDEFVMKNPTDKT